MIIWGILSLFRWQKMLKLRLPLDAWHRKKKGQEWSVHSLLKPLISKDQSIQS